MDSAGYKKLPFNKSGSTVSDITVARTSAQVTAWFTDYNDPKKNTPGFNDAANPGLALGCTADCMAFHDDKQHFKFSTTTFSIKGTDRCGDGFMDGKVVGS